MEFNEIKFYFYTNLLVNYLFLLKTNLTKRYLEQEGQHGKAWASPCPTGRARKPVPSLCPGLHVVPQA